MFENIGQKIKLMAKILCWIGIIFSVIIAVVLWLLNSPYNPTIGTGVIVLFVGGLGSWIGSFFFYGFGELVEYASQQLHEYPQNACLKFYKWQCSRCAAINTYSTCSNCGKKRSIFDRKCA